MNVIERVAPSATDLVRRDHTLVLATFHRYHAGLSPRLKRALVRSVCLALELHARIEEEILYAAMREVEQSDFLRRAPSEHDEMRRLIAQLRETPADSPSYDATFLTLMRDVMHHVADEETSFLPEVERVLRGRLGELGATWMRRRLALLAPRTPRLVYERARGMPAGSMLMLVGLVLGGLLVGQRWSEHTA